MRFFILTLLAFASHAKAALDVDLTSPDSIKTAAKAVASNLMSYYDGDSPGKTPGILPGPPPGGDYYWWEGGALWGTMVDYWRLTGDSTWNNVTESSLIFQSGPPDYQYMPDNWTISLGNDDQGFWGMSAMLAAESNFQNPPESDPGWLALAQAVFNTQASPDRHDDTCGGGLRWQIPPTNIGYNYKNTIANGIFFNIGARLARYTNNATYSDWATKTFDWLVGVGYIDSDYNVFDGAHTGTNCSDIDKAQFSYSAAVLIQGAAFMYNYTNGADDWRDRLQGLVNQTTTYFFSDGAPVERACELTSQIDCTADMKSFKGYLHRWLASATQVAPFIHDQIMATLRESTQAAIQSCTDGVDNGNGVSTATCGFRWTTGDYDGDTGAGQQMNVLAALMTLLIDVDPQAAAVAPVTNSTGGTSVGNNNAGTNSKDSLTSLTPVTAKETAAASIITGVVCLSLTSTLLWMNTNWFEGGLSTPPGVV